MPDPTLQALREAIARLLCVHYAGMIDEELPIADAILVLPEVTELRADAAESRKRLDALIRVRHERDTLRAKMRAVLHLADEMAAETAERHRVAGATPCCDAAARIRAAAEQAHPNQAGA